MVATGRDRHNILLLLTDQQRWDTLGCYGAPVCRTPHIDRLAERGVRFDAAYCNTSPCSPSRAALFTGLYPHNNDVLRNSHTLNPGVPTLASELGQAGYNLGYAGKWHVDQAKVPSEYGFQGKDFPGYGYPPTRGLIEGLRMGGNRDMPRHYSEYLKERGLEPPKLLEAFYGDNPGRQSQEYYALQSGTIEESFECMAAEFATELMRGFAKSQEQEGKPFFLWVNFWGPHTPCFVPEPYYSMYDPNDIAVDPTFAETWHRKPGTHEYYERYWGLSTRTWAIWREIIARYWGYVTMIDDLVGRILNELHALGLEENTLVVFSTDHGDMMGAHRMIEKGPFAYEESWRLPMVAAHPRCETPGAVCDEFVYLQDLFPTFLQVGGIKPPEVPDTQSILDNVLGRATPTGRESVYGAFDGHICNTPLRFVRTRTHKLVYNRSSVGELYDLSSDPGELRNLIDWPEARDVKNELMQLMRKHMLQLNDPILWAFDRIRHVY